MGCLETCNSTRSSITMHKNLRYSIKMVRKSGRNTTTELRDKCRRKDKIKLQRERRCGNGPLSQMWDQRLSFTPPPWRV